MTFTTKFGSGSKKSLDSTKAVEASGAIEHSRFEASKQNKPEQATMFDNSSCFSTLRKHSPRSPIRSEALGTGPANTCTQSQSYRSSDSKLKEVSKSKGHRLSGLLKKAKAKAASKKAAFKARAKALFGKSSSQIKSVPHFEFSNSMYKVKAQFSSLSDVSENSLSSPSTDPTFYGLTRPAMFVPKSNSGHKHKSKSRKSSSKKNKAKKHLNTKHQSAPDSSLGGLAAKCRIGNFDNVLESEDFFRTPYLSDLDFDIQAIGKPQPIYCASSNTCTDVLKPKRGFLRAGVNNWVQKMRAFATKIGCGHKTTEDEETPRKTFPLYPIIFRLPDALREDVFVNLPFLNPLFAFAVGFPAPRHLPVLPSRFSLANYKFIIFITAAALRMFLESKLSARTKKWADNCAARTGSIGRVVCKSVGLFGSKSRVAVDTWISKVGAFSKKVTTREAQSNTDKSVQDQKKNNFDPPKVKPGIISSLFQKKVQPVEPWESLAPSIEQIKLRIRQRRAHKEKISQLIKEGKITEGNDFKPMTQRQKDELFESVFKRPLRPKKYQQKPFNFEEWDARRIKNQYEREKNSSGKRNIPTDPVYVQDRSDYVPGVPEYVPDMSMYERFGDMGEQEEFQF